MSKEQTTKAKQESLGIFPNLPKIPKELDDLLVPDESGNLTKKTQDSEHAKVVSDKINSVSSKPEPTPQEPASKEQHSQPSSPPVKKKAGKSKKVEKKVEKQVGDKPGKKVSSKEPVEKSDAKSRKAKTTREPSYKPFQRKHTLAVDEPVRKEFFSMRLSGKELISLSKKAKRCNMAMSTYVRQAALKSEPREALSKEERELMNKVYDLLDNSNFNVRQMVNYFHSMLAEKNEQEKEKYRGLTLKELKSVIKQQKEVLSLLRKEFGLN